MTSILNGTRFMYIEPLPDGKHLPRINYCGGIQCKLFHLVNQKTPQISAKSAGKLNHTRSRCTSETCCMECKQLGHSHGNEACPHFQPQKHLTTFCGAEDVLSNFYPYELNNFGVIHKSEEHAFQYIKVVGWGDLDSVNAKKVDLMLSLCSPNWEENKIQRTVSFHKDICYGRDIGEQMCTCTSIWWQDLHL